MSSLLLCQMFVVAGPSRDQHLLLMIKGDSKMFCLGSQVVLLCLGGWLAGSAEPVLRCQPSPFTLVSSLDQQIPLHNILLRRLLISNILLWMTSVLPSNHCFLNIITFPIYIHVYVWACLTSLSFWCHHLCTINFFQPQPEVRSFPSEPINPLISSIDGTYIIGGGLSGSIFLWEVASGALLKKWHAHYRAVTCLTFSDDGSLLISGSEDGSVRVWSIYRVFDDMGDRLGQNSYEHSFSEHTLRVTDIAPGYGGCNAVIVSSSEDRTCKVWSLSKGKLLRTVVFPSIIDAVALDPVENSFYAGCRDGKIYIAALNAEGNSSSTYGMHIIGSLSDHSKAVTCLAFSLDGISLISGSEDGTVRVWDTRNRTVTRIFKHAKGPINNILVIRKPLCSSPQTSVNAQSSVSRRNLSKLLPPHLDKYINSVDENVGIRAVLAVQAPCEELLDSQYLSSDTMMSQMQEFQQQGGSAASEMELGRLREDYRRSLQMVLKWKKMYQDLLHLSVNELLDEDHKEGNV